MKKFNYKDNNGKLLLNQIKISSSIGAILILYSVIITVLGYTVVPVDQFYKRQYLPWKNQSQEIV